MIPLRITMTGWMRYRDQQTVDFSGARLLSICGDNGAGKSSIFDAITFALFGSHRLGKQDIGELISEGQPQCSVEFEFEVKEQRYRVRRSRNRGAGAGSQGLWAWDGATNDWIPMTGTTKVDGLNRALEQIIRITPAAFTSSFLLQQGAATEFLDVKPSERFGVVSSLVNLEAYQALEQKARNAQRAEEAEVKRLAAKLVEYEGVDEESLAILQARVQQAGDQAQAAAAERDRAVALVAGAREYARLLTEIEAVSRQLAVADELIVHAAQIEEDARRFATLDVALATLRQIQDEVVAGGVAASAAAAAREALATIDLTAREAAMRAASEQAHESAAVVERLTAEQEAAMRAERAASDFETLAERITALRERIGEQERSLADAREQTARLDAVEREAVRLRETATALPLLQQLGLSRQTVERLRRADPLAVRDALRQQQEQILAERAAVVEAATAAEAALETARREAATARAEAQSLSEQLGERRASIGEAECSRCGQRIDPEQARREIVALEARAGAAQRHAKQAAEAVLAAQLAAKEAVARRDSQHEMLRQTIADLKAAEQAVADLEEATTRERECLEQFRAGAPASLAARIDDTTTVAVLNAVYQEQKEGAARATAVERELSRLHALAGELRGTEAQLARLRTDLATAEQKAGDGIAAVPSAAAAHREAQQQLDTARRALEAARGAAAQAARTEADARDALAAAQRRHETLQSTAASHEQSAAGHRRTAERLAAGLEEPLRATALADPERLLRSLEEDRARLADAPARQEQLQSARQDRSRLEGIRSAHEQQIERIPPEHRVSEGDALAALEAAERTWREAGEIHQRSQRELGKMERDLQEVTTMRAALTRAETRSERFKKLVLLLGKTGLQGALVKEALDTVMSHANSFLQRLTGGSLVLQLERGDGEALDLKAIDASCMREARSVQVLSGSQKFRCAVAIASGIGQYAGAGGMRSIVIDEGFGSLDQQGQHLIIEELKSLADHMDRVVVVSHLDAFSDRVHFPDQIRVVRTSDGSRIERVV